VNINAGGFVTIFELNAVFHESYFTFFAEDFYQQHRLNVSNTFNVLMLFTARIKFPYLITKSCLLVIFYSVLKSKMCLHLYFLDDYV